ncbi:hypothetical protein [Cellvibrio japonicus]|uniref:Putative lipoprotein n=1 Tax=Cellvibrio japonicus (strain Ueda107) TaxID=498211 RepID=B3PDU5_CELJU|nr:hypothetical protein [Cellvibrio japonicus]ACE83674.1 putative lipoprotein [Cellvibrio japonicus Ueda107]QEI13432.1 hypothetical protein FY117_15165 [Cellvibrio japonicus]QEI17006.1 hypothetical protein FY116_15170 [Cellvibrio japonicus]QEI20584.1 hypothetical protein FY115_15165 [Cellvibrio japonicus]
MIRTASSLIVVAVFAALLVACSSPGRSYINDSIQETLEVEILPNTSKMFVYRLRMPQQPDRIQVATSGGPARPPMQGGIQINRSTPERLLENVAYVVRQSGYCREGFMELDRSLAPSHLWVKGECKEGATGEDQERFGRQQVLTSDHWRQRQ